MIFLPKYFLFYPFYSEKKVHSNRESGLPLAGDVQVVVGQRGDAPAPGGSGQKAKLHQIGFVHIFQGHRFFSDGSRQGLQAHRAAGIVLNGPPPGQASCPPLCGIGLA